MVISQIIFSRQNLLEIIWILNLGPHERKASPSRRNRTYQSDPCQ